MVITLIFYHTIYAIKLPRRVKEQENEILCHFYCLLTCPEFYAVLLT